MSEFCKFLLKKIPVFSRHPSCGGTPTLLYILHFFAFLTLLFRSSYNASTLDCTFNLFFSSANPFDPLPNPNLHFHSLCSLMSIFCLMTFDVTQIALDGLDQLSPKSPTITLETLIPIFHPLSPFYPKFTLFPTLILTFLAGFFFLMKPIKSSPSTHA